MTPPGRTRLIRIAGLLAALALFGTACATGKQQPDAGTTQPGGAGQFGSVPVTATTPVATTTAPTAAPTASAGGGPGIILRPPIIILNPAFLWPSPQDCITYDPSTVTIRATSVWQIVAGSDALLAFRTLNDANQGLALAKEFSQQCFVGRGDQAAAGDVMTYWLSPVSGAAAVPNPDCISYDPSQLSVVSSGSRWLVQTPSDAIESFVSQADANNAKLVMSHYNQHCYVGRDYSGSDRASYITEWFANS